MTLFISKIKIEFLNAKSEPQENKLSFRFLLFFVDRSSSLSLKERMKKKNIFKKKKRKEMDKRFGVTSNRPLQHVQSHISSEIFGFIANLIVRQQLRLRKCSCGRESLSNRFNSESVIVFVESLGENYLFILLACDKGKSGVEVEKKLKFARKKNISEGFSHSLKMKHLFA